MTNVAVIDPAIIQPRGQLILAVPYERPEATPGGLLIPEPFRVDPFWCYYEVVTAGPDCAKLLGMALRAGDILRCDRFRPPIDSGYQGADGRRLYFVPCTVEQEVQGKMRRVANVTGIIPKTWED